MPPAPLKLITEYINGCDISSAEAASIMHAIASQAVPPFQIAALLTAIAIRGIDLDILDGFSKAALELATPANLGFTDVIDICGTGGDGKGAFNISTTAAFILAGAGLRVAKHGNVGVSSGCGSSDLLPLLGINLSPDVDTLKRSIERNGVCFIHAPHFHPAFKALTPIRKELGFRTVFNALGPLINPCRPSFRLAGVYSFELQRVYSYLLQQKGATERFAVVHTIDGYDEVSLTSKARIVTDLGACELDPDLFKDALAITSAITPKDLMAYPDNALNAKLVEGILKGEERGARRAVVLANAGVAIWCYRARDEGARLDIRRLAESLALAAEALDSGRAYAALKGCRGE